jgi:hypothetical protein
VSLPRSPQLPVDAQVPVFTTRSSAGVVGAIAGWYVVGPLPRTPAIVPSNNFVCPLTVIVCFNPEPGITAVALSPCTNGSEGT